MLADVLVSENHGKLTWCLVGVLLEDLQNLSLPVHIELLGKVLPLRRARVAHEATMLRAEAQLGNVAKVLLKELLVTTGNNPDGVSGIGR